MADVPYYSSLSHNSPVISPQFCASQPVNLLIDENVLTVRNTKYVVTSADGNLMFKVERYPSSLHGTLLVRDAAGSPVITLQPKKWTHHSRWQVFKGQSRDKKDLIFSAKRSSMFQIHTKLDVFLANNTSEEYCDFKVTAGYLDRSCDIYAGDSSTPIARMEKKRTAASIFVGKDKFMVTVSTSVDCAMVVALIIILEEITS